MGQAESQSQKQKNNDKKQLQQIMLQQQQFKNQINREVSAAQQSDKSNPNQFRNGFSSKMLDSYKQIREKAVTDIQILIKLCQDLIENFYGQNFQEFFQPQDLLEFKINRVISQLIFTINDQFNKIFSLIQDLGLKKSSKHQKYYILQNQHKLLQESDLDIKILNDVKRPFRKTIRYLTDINQIKHPWGKFELIANVRNIVTRELDYEQTRKIEFLKLILQHKQLEKKERLYLIQKIAPQCSLETEVESKINNEYIENKNRQENQESQENLENYEKNDNNRDQNSPTTDTNIAGYDANKLSKEYLNSSLRTTETTAMTQNSHRSNQQQNQNLVQNPIKRGNSLNDVQIGPKTHPKTSSPNNNVQKLKFKTQSEKTVTNINDIKNINNINNIKNIKNIENIESIKNIKNIENIQKLNNIKEQPESLESSKLKVNQKILKYSKYYTTNYLQQEESQIQKLLQEIEQTTIMLQLDDFSNILIFCMLKSNKYFWIKEFNIINDFIPQEVYGLGQDAQHVCNYEMACYFIESQGEELYKQHKLEQGESNKQTLLENTIIQSKIDPDNQNYSYNYSYNQSGSFQQICVCRNNNQICSKNSSSSCNCQQFTASQQSLSDSLSYSPYRKKTGNRISPSSDQCSEQSSYQFNSGNNNNESEINLDYIDDIKIQRNNFRKYGVSFKNLQKIQEDDKEYEKSQICSSFNANLSGLQQPSQMKSNLLLNQKINQNNLQQEQI
ncbi:hypothetical protein PPERSA_10760 [Pseudocohnilembus persalinus]|uniref:Uncharacterized protein n=1 Tax=Pseudocohnilembus persalinus TaxID=266149 RepID=A0A0V0QDP2_PSEPJ|nr:hypothetical protein PPERSA_10760 [Pseudocohnilembus persalinus]|eukprot:KRX00261.1 hypothetical protein PPERSA_10760 [Pseudocohnilembus persalinus]